jgi:hypothetical protein
MAKCNVHLCGRKLSFIEQQTCLCSKCQKYHCTVHRLAEAHLCSHNYKDDLDKAEFIEANKCVAEKIKRTF